jgi:uncharacterized membrane protein (DUF4010 family)
MISSTATTVSYARRTRETTGTEALAALVIVLASTTVFARVLIEIGAVAPGHFRQLAFPIATMAVVCLLISLGAFFFTRHGNQKMPEQDNPAELKSAILFGAMYGVGRALDDASAV